MVQINEEEKYIKYTNIINISDDKITGKRIERRDTYGCLIKIINIDNNNDNTIILVVSNKSRDDRYREKK